MTTTPLGNGLEARCPSWCDNAYNRRQHDASCGSVLHRQVVGSGEEWRVALYTSDDGQTEDEPEASVDCPQDWSDAGELLRFAHALSQAALLLARHRLDVPTLI
jgi:hypothetical protein